MPELETWGGGSEFSYEGSVEDGTNIKYGNGRKVRVNAQQYKLLRQHFRNRVVQIGTTRNTKTTEPPPSSLGAWLFSNVTKTAIASYVGPILIREGYAEKVGKDEISFTS